LEKGHDTKKHPTTCSFFSSLSVPTFSVQGK